MIIFKKLPLYGLSVGACLLLAQGAPVWAGNTSISKTASVSNLNAWADNRAITDLNFSSLSGGRVQIELTVNGAIDKPTIFQTDNPSRIALDFVGVHSNLEKKMYPINQGAAKAIYVVEASGRTRIVIHLTKMLAYETKMSGDDKFYIILKPAHNVEPKRSQPAPVQKAGKHKKKYQPGKVSQHKSGKNKNYSKFLPKQGITDIDFRRGKKGEGRILVSLSKKNTMVDVKEKGGKVVLNFMNTTLPQHLAKSYDVSDFATPVQKIDVQPKGKGVLLEITPGDGNYDYLSYQSDGVLTIDFIPLTPDEKEALLRKKFTYTGKKLTFNFQDIEVRSVLQILADFTGLNIVAADTVTGNVSLRLNDVPWDQALDLILKSKGLAKRQSGNVVLVAPATEIIKIEQDELDANRVVAQLEPLRTEYIQINYAKAEDIQALLVGSNVVKGASSQPNSAGQQPAGGNRNIGSRSSQSAEMKGMLSSRGSSTVDGRTNTIIVKDTVKQLERIAEMIKILDVPVRQVMIEARIVTADTSFAQEIGVRFGVAKAAEVGSDHVFGLGAGGETYSEIVPDSSGSNLTVPDGTGYLVDLGASAINSHPVGALGMTLARAADYVLNLELSALENENRGEVLANPRVMTSDRELAYIKQGVQIPYTTVSQDGTKTELIDAVLELNVTPQITPDGDVIMELLIKKDSPDTATGGIDKREIETVVRVRDGETVVLGGVYEGVSGKEMYKVPFLADLPGVGFLFRKKIESDRKKELLIFVTPKIVKSTLTSSM